MSRWIAIARGEFLNNRQVLEKSRREAVRFVDFYAAGGMTRREKRVMARIAKKIKNNCKKIKKGIDKQKTM